MPFDANDPDTKKALKDAIDTALAEARDASEADLDALKKKNADLIKEKRELQKSSTITPEQLAAVEGERDELKTKLTAAEKTAKEATTAAEKATKALETESAFTQRLLIQDGLKTALIANGVKDEDFLDTLTAKFAGGASVVVDGEARKAMFGDKLLADHIKEWAGSESGKKFVTAPGNGGGGAGGGGGGAGGKQWTRAQFDAATPLERTTFAKDGGKVVDTAA